MVFEDYIYIRRLQKKWKYVKLLSLRGTRVLLTLFTVSRVKKNNRKYNDLLVVRFIKQRWYKNRCDIEFCPMKSYEGECFNCLC